ncbi:MAG: hypothetical protein M1840_005436 [Geoglossum simile]|nr:MAG: hypothetical protein M1840_005436 [Geoglossum simile]
MPLVARSPRNRVILGLMTFGPDPSTGARITSLDEFKEILDYFQSQSYGEVDTARGYVGGRQEEFTAQAGWKDRGLKLATKVYPVAAGLHKPDVLKASFQESLTALDADQVDVFYLHAADRSVPFAETLEAVNELHKQGKFIEFGLSNFTAFEVAEVVITCKERGWVRPTIYQAMYNAITRSIEPELVVACRRYGIDIVVYNPLAGGFLSGKYKTTDVPLDGRFSNASGIIGSIYRKRFFKDTHLEALRVVEPVVQAHNLTLPETALRWLVHHSALRITPESGGNDGVIIGVSNIDQLKSNLKDLEKGRLPMAVVQALDEAWKVAMPEVPNYWHLTLEYTYDTQKALFGAKDQHIGKVILFLTMDPFSTEGELLNIHNAFHQGQYSVVLEIDASSFSPENALPARILALRSRIALGQAIDVITELEAESHVPDLVVVRSLAQYAVGDKNEAVQVAEIQAGKSPDNATVQVVGGTILHAAGRSEAALELLGKHQGNLEAVALIVQIYLQQNRTDLALKEVLAARRWAQDSLLVNIAESWVGLRVGGEKYQQAFYVFEELAQAPSSSAPKSLVGQAVTELHLGRLPEAEAALQQALDKDSKNPDAMVNMIVLSVISGKETAGLASPLKATAPEHPFLVDLQEKSVMFDKAAAKYSAKVA